MAMRSTSYPSGDDLIAFTRGPGRAAGDGGRSASGALRPVRRGGRRCAERRISRGMAVRENVLKRGGGASADLTPYAAGGQSTIPGTSPEFFRSVGLGQLNCPPRVTERCIDCITLERPGRRLIGDTPLVDFVVLPFDLAVGDCSRYDVDTSVLAIAESRILP